MTQLSWGMKRTCSSCNVMFYDFWKNPVPCPKCETPFEIQISGKGKRLLKSVLKDLDIGHDTDMPLEDIDDVDKEDIEDGADILSGL
jgi:hypothetical protein